MPKSEYNGDLWVTYHRSAKLEGMWSINSICERPCEFKSFCYAKRLEKYRPKLHEKYRKNKVALERSTCKVPIFPEGSIVRWFSFGSINGSKMTVANICATVRNNPTCKFGIWLEPRYWEPFYSLFKYLPNITCVYSHKVIDDPIVAGPGYNTFSIVSSSAELKAKLSEYPNAIVCKGKCKECGFKCYLERGLTIIEKKK